MLSDMYSCIFLIFLSFFFFFFFFNDTATTEIYTLSLHDALPIFFSAFALSLVLHGALVTTTATESADRARSEEHTSELQSQFHLVCRLLLEKKKKKKKQNTHYIIVIKTHFTITIILYLL